RCSPSARVPTQSDPPAETSEVGPPPAAEVPTTALRRASIRETDDEYSFAAKTELPFTASATGSTPTVIVATTAPATGSILETVWSRLFVTQIAPSSPTVT